MSAPARPVAINQHYTRAINVLRDIDNRDSLAAYLPTPRALQTLRNIADTFTATHCPRAWSLVGPYGAGKSSFAVFLSALLAEPNQAASQTARALLERHDAKLAAACRNARFLRVHVNGNPDPMAAHLLQALHRDTASQCPDTDPALLKRLKRAARDGASMAETLELLGQLQTDIAAQGFNGLLLIIDELGKFLEYQAYHPHSQDIHLLQLLAEHTYPNHPAPLYLVTLLHQSFEQYVQGAGKKRKDEWLKVQGRFATVAFIESAEQILRVVATAFTERDLPAGIVAQTIEQAETLYILGALPGALDADQAANWFARCHPLHPLTLLILPSLCQKVAQNERTLFTYLGSQETHGFQQALESLPPGAWVQPWDIYDYFVLNQASALTDAFTHHRWMEVVTALDRLGAAADENAVRLLKTIGLLNIIGSQAGLKASPDILALCGLDNLPDTLAELQHRSCIQWRKFNQEYRVWQGSDFDLAAALAAAVTQLADFDLAAQLNAQRPLSPIVARRISIETGALRYFLPQFTDRAAWPSDAAQTAPQPRLWVYLAEDSDDKPNIGLLNEQDALALYQQTERLREAVGELAALELLPRQHAELHQDPVAQREYDEWLGAAQQHTQRLLASLLDEPQNQRWYRQNLRYPINSKRELQSKLSDWMAETYPDAPHLKNELINRDKPSPSANTGRKKLLTAMLENPGAEDLGFTKDPAEKSMYRALLHATGLHQHTAAGWRFTAPPYNRQDTCKLHPCWDAITDFLNQQAGTPQTLPDLYAILRKPPFGIKAGALPVLFVAYLLAESRAVALYQEGEFCTALTADGAELLCRRPELFSVERFNLGGVRGHLFQRYLSTIIGQALENADLLDIVRPLARFIIALPEYTRQTTQLSREARQVRDALKQAKNPGRLLFQDLPVACGYAAFADDADPGASEDFINRLAQAFRELSGAYDALLHHWQHCVSRALLERDEADLPTLRRQAASRYAGLEHRAANADGLGPFVRRLSSATLADRPWLYRHIRQ